MLGLCMETMLVNRRLLFLVVFSRRMVPALGMPDGHTDFYYCWPPADHSLCWCGRATQDCLVGDSIQVHSIPFHSVVGHSIPFHSIPSFISPG